MSDDSGSLAQQNVWMAFNVDKQTVLETGFELGYYRLGNTALALRWLERAKSRALLDALAKIPIPADHLERDPALRKAQALGTARASGRDLAEDASAEADHAQKELRHERRSTAHANYCFYSLLQNPEPPEWPHLRDLHAPRKMPPRGNCSAA
jgi:hypothetical protein